MLKQGEMYLLCFKIILNFPTDTLFRPWIILHTNTCKLLLYNQTKLSLSCHKDVTKMSVQNDMLSCVFSEELKLTQE